MTYKYEFTTEEIRDAVIYSMAVETIALDPPSREQAGKAFDRWLDRIEKRKS